MDSGSSDTGGPSLKTAQERTEEVQQGASLGAKIVLVERDSISEMVAEQTLQGVENVNKPDLRIQLVSDLHIEMREPPDIPVMAPVLALLGDIAWAGTEVFADFTIRKLAQKHETVLFIAGNHDYYKGDYWEGKAVIRKLVKALPNVHFLDCSSVEIRGVKVLGCTLWSHVPDFAELEVHGSISDYSHIDMEAKGKKLSVWDTNTLHRLERDFLEKEIRAAKEAGETVLVLTHHAPLLHGTSAPEFEGGDLNHAFCTDLRELMGSPVAAWGFGHTHFNPRGLVVKGTRVLSNQMGYDEKDLQGDRFDPGLVLHVKGPMETSVERSSLRKY